MSWMMEPLWNEDPWIRSLSIHAAHVWVVCLTGSLRLGVPGLCRVSPGILVDAVGENHLDFEAAARTLAELAAPDEAGSRHVLYDPGSRVLRIPRAPAYNHAYNASILTSWYREWLKIPDCQLKFDHVESLKSGVNFNVETVAACWKRTFSSVEDAVSRGEKPRSPAVGRASEPVPRRSAPSLNSDQRPLRFPVAVGSGARGTGLNGAAHGAGDTGSSPPDPEDSFSDSDPPPDQDPKTDPGRPLAATEKPVQVHAATSGRPKRKLPPGIE